MNNVLAKFSYEGNEIGAIQDENGIPWLIASGVCKALEYANTSKAVEDHVDREDIAYLRQLPGQVIPPITRRYTPGSSLLINESGLYSLILRSGKPEVRRFKKWVTSEVLPSIRKTGSYSTGYQAEIRPPITTGYTPSPELAAFKLAVATLEAHERRLSRLEIVVETWQQERQEAEQLMLALPKPSDPAPEKTTRAVLNELVRSFVATSGADYTATWGKLYRELYYREHFDVKARALEKGQNLLDLVEDAGLLDALYAIACEVLK